MNFYKERWLGWNFYVWKRTMPTVNLEAYYKRLWNAEENPFGLCGDRGHGGRWEEAHLSKYFESKCVTRQLLDGVHEEEGGCLSGEVRRRCAERSGRVSV